MKRMICLLLAAVLCLGLLTACGGDDSGEKNGGKTEETAADKLVGTWSLKEERESELRITFNKDGSGSWEQYETGSVKWSVDKNQVLSLNIDGQKFDLEYGKEAKNGDETCWYIVGDTLYMMGLRLSRGSGADAEPATPHEPLTHDEPAVPDEPVGDKTDFNLAYTESDVEAFLNSVCKHIDADSAKVVDVSEEEFVGETYLYGTLEIRLSGRAAQQITVGFDKDSSGMVSTMDAQIAYYQTDEQNDCALAFILGLEEMLGGGHAALYLADCEDYEAFVNSYQTMETIADYRVCGTATAAITAMSGDGIWFLTYTLTRG